MDSDPTTHHEAVRDNIKTHEPITLEYVSKVKVSVIGNKGVTTASSTMANASDHGDNEDQTTADAKQQIKHQKPYYV